MLQDDNSCNYCYLLETRHRMQYNADAISAPDLSPPSIHGFRLLHPSYPPFYHRYITKIPSLTRHRGEYTYAPRVRVCFFRGANSVTWSGFLGDRVMTSSVLNSVPSNRITSRESLRRIERLGSFSCESDRNILIEK